MKDYEKPVTKEMWYIGQKAQSDRIKQLEKKIIRLIELIEDHIQNGHP